MDHQFGNWRSDPNRNDMIGGGSTIPNYPPATNNHSIGNTSNNYHHHHHQSNQYHSNSHQQAYNNQNQYQSNHRGQQPKFNKYSARGKSSKSQSGSQFAHLPQLDQPLYDSEAIHKSWTRDEPPRQEWLQNPKGILNTFSQRLSHPLTYHTEQVMFAGFSQPKFRATVQLDTTSEIVGIGDDINKKEAEKLAALSVCFQLGLKDMFDQNNLPIQLAVREPSPEASVTAPDGRVITPELAKAFMNFYCNKSKLERHEVYYESKLEKGRQTWLANLCTGSTSIGIGEASTKRGACHKAYMEAVQKFVCDENGLWEEFKMSPESCGLTSSGPVPGIVFKISEELEQDLRRLAYSSRDSGLYRQANLILEARDSARIAPSANQNVINNSNIQDKRDSPEHQSMLANKSIELKTRLESYTTDLSPLVVDLREQRQNLPVTSHASLVLSAIETNPITILMAATGSGKTTQVPQLILDQAIMSGEGSKCNIICTQPRRIAAMSVAQRVANERNEELGQSVGYQVRFDAKPPTPDGSILFCTTGVFLRKLQNDMGRTNGAFLDSITHVVVDEVHERDIETDLLLFCLRKVLQDRRDRGKAEIKVLLMSATVDPILFEQYFANPQTAKQAPVISVPGRSFPVEKHYLEKIDAELRQLSLPPNQGGWVWQDPKVEKYMQRELREPLALDPITGKVLRDSDDLEMPFALVALVTAWVLSKSSEGHVLVFLPGWEEIKGVQTILTDSNQFPLLGLDFNDLSKFEIHVLHSAIPVAEQQRVFTPPTPGVRRVILSTNIAETSVTIPDVVFVVDTGKIKEKRFDPERHLSSLITAWVGTSNLNQRAGRAGRHRPGDYFGLLSERRQAALNVNSTVEMKRTDLSNLVMHVKALNFPNMEAEDVLAQTIEPPESERVSAAMSHLEMIGALDRHKDLTSLGRVLLQLPVEAQIGKLLLMGSFFKCLEPALNLAAILTNRDPFLSPRLAKAEADRVKCSWAPQEFRSDPLAALAAFKAWSRLSDAGEHYRAQRFATENFLSKPTLLQIAQVKSHLLSALRRAGVLAISGGGESEEEYLSGPQGHHRVNIPAHLNKNSGSWPLYAALIAVAAAPNFAIRRNARSLATDKDRSCYINLSSVNSHKKQIQSTEKPPPTEREVYAFGEKSLQLPRPGDDGEGQMSLRSTTKLDSMVYMLFGARQLLPQTDGLKCDGWLPITGNEAALDDVERLKHVLDASLLRVFDGLRGQIFQNESSSFKGHPRRVALRSGKSMTNKNGNQTQEEESGESDFEDEEEDQEEGVPASFQKLTRQEMKDLQHLTEGVVLLLNKFSNERPGAASKLEMDRALMGRFEPGADANDGPNFRGNSNRTGNYSTGQREYNHNNGNWANNNANRTNNNGNWANNRGSNNSYQSGVPSRLTPGGSYQTWNSGPGSSQHSYHSQAPRRGGSGFQSARPPQNERNFDANWRS